MRTGRCNACPYRTDGPQTPDGELVFEAIAASAGQLLYVAGLGGGMATGLNMGSALALGGAMGADMDLLAAVLPAAEAAMLSRRANDGEDALPGEEGH